MCPEYAILTWPYAKLRNIPIVMWYAHGNVNMRLRITCFLVNRIVSSSQEGFRINSKRLTIAGQGIDVEKFKPRAPNSKPKNGKKIILSVGRISPVKNYETLIRALDILVNQWDARYLELQIVGDVPRKSQNKYLYFLKNLIGRYKLEDYVKFSGPISYTQIENYYQNCELFISTSNTGSLDKVVLEAMACGKIVLTSNEAFNNLLEAYSYILKFDKNDAYGLAEKIVYILEMNTQDRDALAYNLREIVVQKHSLGRLIGKLVGIFQNLI